MKLSTILAMLPAALAAPTPPEILPRDGTPIAGRYIVKFRTLLGIDFDSMIQPALQLLKVEPTHLYNFNGFGGLAGEMSDDVARLMRLLPIVEFVEQDKVVRANLGEVVEIEKRAYTTQAPAVWGLSRISSKAPGTSNYTYDNSAASGSCAYIIDTGIDVSHPEFEGRATFLANYAGDNDNTDGQGHGTHVAGIVGSKTYGVAKNIKLFAVKVLDANGSGTSSNLIAGINYAANDSRSRGCASYVANLSLGGDFSAAVNSASANAVASGLFMSVAAGNEAVDAKNSSPASESNVFTVGATDASDTFASFSNFGAVVDILAPGDRILSTYTQNRLAYLSGTSMAAPHVAGLAAYLLTFEGKMSPSTLSSRIRSLGLKGLVKNVPSGTVNNLAFNGNPRG